MFFFLFGPSRLLNDTKNSRFFKKSTGKRKKAQESTRKHKKARTFGKKHENLEKSTEYFGQSAQQKR